MHLNASIFEWFKNKGYEDKYHFYAIIKKKIEIFSVSTIFIKKL